jgi:acid stress chaperone HdeB
MRPPQMRCSIDIDRHPEMVLARRSETGIAPIPLKKSHCKENDYENDRCAFGSAGLMLSSAPSHAVVLDLSTMTCKQFLEGGDDTIKMVLTWMDGWYKGDSDEAIIDTDVFVENAKKFGSFCGKNPTISIVNAAEKVLGK